MKAPLLIKYIKQYAKETDISYFEAISRFVSEEFLRRISLSRHKDNFILRGGYLVEQLTDFEGVSSNSLDFLYIENDENIKEILENIIKTETQFECCNFDLVSYRELDEKSVYKGFEVVLNASLGAVKIGLELFLGVDDILYHQTDETEITPIYNGSEAFEILTYPVESVIAEKFDIILNRFELNNTVKHLYDIVLLSQTFDFEGIELQHAIKATLENRKNDCKFSRIDQISKLADNDAISNRWQHFIIENNIDMTLVSALTVFVKFIEPVYKAILENSRWQKNWSGSDLEWQDPMYLY